MGLFCVCVNNLTIQVLNIIIQLYNIITIQYYYKVTTEVYSIVLHKELLLKWLTTIHNNNKFPRVVKFKKVLGRVPSSK